MPTKVRRSRIGVGRETLLWPVLLSLLVVLVPTACVLWFMNEAMRNERLAARQKLADAYRGHAALLQDRLQRHWKQQLDALEGFAASGPGSGVFASCLRAGLADGVICYDAQGRVIYPAPLQPAPVEPGAEGTAWTDAARREYEENDPRSAAGLFAAIASQASDANTAARAFLAQSRCLVKAGRRQDAIAVLTQSLGQEKYAEARDPHGRLIVADAELRALQLMGDRTRPAFQAVAQRLQRRLSSYQDPLLAGPQRLFLMKQFELLLPESTFFPTLSAEELAASFLELRSPPAKGPYLRPTGLKEVWQVAPSGGRVVALLRTATVRSRSLTAMRTQELSPDVTIALLPPGEEPPQEAVFRSLPAGPYLPGWGLTLWLNEDQLAETAAEQTALHFWIGCLVIAAMSVLAVLIAHSWRRQLRLTRLKNDLVATVSHELKTPLASIRLLVDTLLDAKTLDEPTVREYMELVAKENTRLSHLVDNFLTFSRMERQKYAFELAETPPGDIIAAAVDAVRERFSSPRCRFEVQTTADLPLVRADRDALTAVLLNLLDNAYKYSGDDKHIVVRAYLQNGNVCLEVADNGTGISRRATKRVFERFYQVDQRLSRTGGGCGLGLSIVQFIVHAHGGTVRVESQLGRGSTFTVILPAVAAPSTPEDGRSK